MEKTKVAIVGLGTVAPGVASCCWTTATARRGTPAARCGWKPSSSAM